MVGLDVTRQASAGPKEVERLRTLGRVGEVAADLVTFSSDNHRRVFGSDGPPIHDAVAVAAVVEPAVLEARPMRVEIECESELTRGETVCDLRGVWASRQTPRSVYGWIRRPSSRSCIGRWGRWPASRRSRCSAR